jgi:hypothetical protein
MKQLRHGSSSLTSSKYRRSLNRRCPIREVSCHQLLQSCHSVTPTWVTWDGATLHPPGLPGTVLLYTHLGYLGRCYFTPTWVTWDGATLHLPPTSIPPLDDRPPRPGCYMLISCTFMPPSETQLHELPCCLYLFPFRSSSLSLCPCPSSYNSPCRYHENAVTGASWMWPIHSGPAHPS